MEELPDSKGGQCNDELIEQQPEYKRIKELNEIIEEANNDKRRIECSCGNDIFKKIPIPKGTKYICIICGLSLYKLKEKL